MTFRLLADATVLLHLAFVLFVVCGGLLVLWRPLIAWIHVPAAVWGAWVEFSGWICPLTPLENWLRTQGGRTTYDSSFVDYYIVPTLYPASLTRETQLVFGGLVVVVNAVAYAIVLRRRSRHA
jgi:hypothetical protein